MADESSFSSVLFQQRVGVFDHGTKTRDVCANEQSLCGNEHYVLMIVC